MAEEDIIFGKNRHLFGGIAPGNMRSFGVRASQDGSHTPVIVYEPPLDTVIDGQTVCAVEGVMIRRKTDGWPLNEFDGEEFAVITESGSMPDLNATDPNLDYYYAAFPYSTQGVYNRNSANRVAVYNTLAFSDYSNIGELFECPFGQRPPIFVYPDTNTSINIMFYWGVNYDIDGCMVRRSTNGYPKDITDGELVGEVTNDIIIDIVDSGLTEEVTCYYTLFPHTTKGTYIYNDDFKVKCTPRWNSYFYGFDLDINDPNPNTRVTYPENVDNAAFVPAKMNYDVGVFDYGDWPSGSNDRDAYNQNKGIFLPKPVMLSKNGEVIENLDPNDYGNDSEYYKNYSSCTHNAMMQWPKIYVKRTFDEINGIYSFRCSDYKLDSDYECICNYDKDGNEIDYFYTPIYEGYNYSSTLRSVSGVDPTTAITPNQSLNYASKNGARWTTEVLADRLLIQDLLILMAKTTDCQKAYGKGVCGSNTAIKTGTMDKKGLFWGSNNPSEGVKVFGMENWWGNHARYLAGLLTNNHFLYAKFTRGTTDYSATSVSDYDQVGRLGTYIGTVFKASENGYVRKMVHHKYGRIPYDSGGSSTTYEADTISRPSSSAEVYYPATGGYNSSAEGAVGPFTLEFPIAGSTTSTTSAKYGAALSYK